MIDMTDFALGIISGRVASDVSSNHSLRRTAEVFELRIKHYRLVAHLSSVTLECGIWHLLAREQVDENTDLRV